MTTTQHRANLSTLHARLDEQEDRLKDIEARLAKYDVIIERLSTLVEVYGSRIHDISERAEAAIDGQQVIAERNESAHRWSTVWISVASSTVVGVLMFVLGHALPH